MEEERKQVITYEENDDYDGRPYTMVRYACPNCDGRLYPYEKRCPYCEQLLDWSNV